MRMNGSTSAGAKRLQVKKILIPVRGNSVDEDTIRLACRLVKSVKGKIYVTYVIEVKPIFPLDAVIEPEMTKAEELLSRAEVIAEEEDYEVETDLLKARDVGPAIVDEAIERQVDLIMIGNSHKKKFGQFSLGSTVPYVMKNAPCWVLVCQEPMPKEEHLA